MSTVVVCQSNYIPWKGYFDLIRKADYFVFYDIVQYTKNDWRNRNKIQSPAGPQWLTVPVIHQHLAQPIHSVQIANSLWQKKHWKTLQQNYGKAAYFSLYAEQIKVMYQQDWLYLSELNQSFIKLICSMLQIETRFVDISTLTLAENRSQRLVDICQQVDATTYLSGPAAKSYLELDKFAQQGIEVQWMDYGHYKAYPQLHEPFEHGVSVLDLLFNKGPEAINYL
jgi:hypothetical protein